MSMTSGARERVESHKPYYYTVETLRTLTRDTAAYTVERLHN